MTIPAQIQFAKMIPGSLGAQKFTRQDSPDGLVLEGMAVNYNGLFPSGGHPVKYVVSPDAIGESVIGRFMKKPLLLWSHDMYSPAVGKVLALENRPDGLWMRAVILNTGLGKDLISLIIEGAIESVSISFYGKFEQEKNEDWPDEDEDTEILRVAKIKLLQEISVVNLGMDDEAVVEIAQNQNFAMPGLGAAFIRSDKMTITPELLAEVQQEAKKGGESVVLSAVKPAIDRVASLEAQVRAFDGLIERDKHDRETFITKITGDFAAAVDKLSNDRNAAIAGASGACNLKEIPLTREMLLTMPSDMLRALFRREVLDDILEFRAWNDRIFLLDMMLQHNMDYKMTPPVKRIGALKWGKYLNRIAGKFAMDTTTSAEGSQYVPVAYSSQLIDMVRQASRVDALFEQWPMQQASQYRPVEGADIIATRHAEVTAVATAPDSVEQTPGSANALFTAECLRTRVQVSGELTEDSIIPIIEYVMRKSAIGMARAMDKWDLSGDNAGATNFDSLDTPGATDCRYCGNGLRQVANARSGGVDASSWTAEKFTDLWTKMGVFGENPGNLVMITSLKVYLKHLLNMKNQAGETITTTVDKMGPAATFLTGQLAAVYAIPVILSEFVLNTLDANGFYTAASEDHSEVLLVHRPSFSRGNWKSPNSELIRDGINNVWNVVTWYRGDFQCVYAASTPASGDICAVFGYGIPTA